MSEEINIKEIYKLAIKSFNLSERSKRISNKVGNILKKLHPELEEELRYDYSFLNEMMDYGEAIYNEEEILKQINKALEDLKEKKA